jgi:hypothetical protein
MIWRAGDHKVGKSRSRLLRVEIHRIHGHCHRNLKTESFEV